MNGVSCRASTTAIPGRREKQYKPTAWERYDFQQLRQDIYNYTKKVITALMAQGTPPDKVQVGNEINHGILWPRGNISHPGTLAAFLRSGIAARKGGRS